MTQLQKITLGVVFGFLAVTASQAEPLNVKPDDEHSVTISYGGKVFGIPVVRARLSAAFEGRKYAARADFRSSGLASLFKKIKVVASTSGQKKGEIFWPESYWHKELDGRKNRELSMNYGPQTVTIRVNPPLYSMGDPIASMSQRLEALDPVSGLLALSQPKKGGLCTGSVKIFDGKQRYNLRMEALGFETVRTRAYKGMALRCHVWYEPVAGFDADDLANPEAYEKPIIMWLAKNSKAGLHLPVRFEARLDFGRAVVEARKIEVKSTSEH